MSRPAVLILAAGASSRMRGRDKLLEEVAPGTPLLAERAAAAVATGAPVLVALPPVDEAPARWAALDGLAVTRLAAARAATGMSASLRAGLKALPPHSTAVVILLADMPDITSADITALIAADDGQTRLRGATSDGRPGHPVLLQARDLPALSGLTGDVGARDLLATGPVRLVPLAGNHALTDLDTPEDWARWRATH